MEDLNKITSTRVGDNIHFFVNGTEDKGTVVKMDSSYVTVVKDDGRFQDIHINDTFFIKDILVNKTWNDMSMEERTVALHEVHAYSPRFLAKSWKQLPKSLKDVMLEKSNVEQSHHGSAGRSNQVVETSTAFDADEDYDGESDDTKEEQFKHDKEKPKVTNKSMQEQIWEQWLEKGDMGGDSAPADNGTSSTNENGMYNPVYGDKGRHGGQGKDKDEETEDEKDKKEHRKE